MSKPVNYRHLYYFWVVANEGGMAKAAERLDMAVQTISAQVRELEKSLGHALLKPAGRGLVLTEAGQAAVKQADQIFQLGERLPDIVRTAAQRQTGMRLAVGISDSLPKLVVRRLLLPVIHEPDMRLLCLEKDFDDLLADLALHRLDVVLTDHMPAPNANLRLYGHSLGSSPMAWYAPAEFFKQAQAKFPYSLADVPVLLPTSHASVRSRIDQWFERIGVVPHVVGEFHDSALLATFAADGMGVFPVASWAHDKMQSRYQLQRLGDCDGVEEHFFALATQKKIEHPLVKRLLPTQNLG